MFNIKFLDSNRGPQVSEVTAFPTETQPLSKFSAYCIKNIDFNCIHIFMKHNNTFS